MKEKDFYQYPNNWEKKILNKIIIFYCLPFSKEEKKSTWSEIIFILLQCSLSKNNNEKYTWKEKKKKK